MTANNSSRQTWIYNRHTNRLTQFPADESCRSKMKESDWTLWNKVEKTYTVSKPFHLYGPQISRRQEKSAYEKRIQSKMKYNTSPDTHTLPRKALMKTYRTSLKESKQVTQGTGGSRGVSTGEVG